MELNRYEKHRWWYFILLGWVVFALLFFALPVSHGSYAKAHLLRALSNTKQIYTAFQSADVDYSVTGQGAAGIWYPADLGVKTNLEYVTRLVQHGVFKESDLSLFCKPGIQVNALKDLKREHLAFCFANISEKDARSSNAVWMVTRNVVEGMPAPKKWWDFSKDDPFSKGYIIFRIGGDGAFYTQNNPPDLKTLGGLPPREPKFLEP
ncbi:MAG: hypothetical protein B9S32_13050 [Verrucomicrobia bacterium Tous-C9LFEB]|nr:MAG: hypothetical protein B9S32_13050 [Verrucomicrobia bacterium Tous-C9LFEB]